MIIGSEDYCMSSQAFKKLAEMIILPGLPL